MMEARKKKIFGSLSHIQRRNGCSGVVAVTAAQFGNHRDEFLVQFLKSNHEQTEQPQKTNQLILKPSALQLII